MIWKDWSYAKRGGILLILISFVLSLLFGLTGMTSFITHSSNSMQIFIIFLLPGILSMFPLMFAEVIPLWVGIILMIVISLIIWFLIGVFMGWILGKIKQKINRGN